jgi:hypothetical protein
VNSGKSRDAPWEREAGAESEPPFSPDAVTRRSRSSSDFGVPRQTFAATLADRARYYFLGVDPSFWAAMVPALVLSAVLYTRSVASNFIFDEQEALLANPYVNGKGLPFGAVIHRDFWGLPPERSVGSYRPLPNVVWRLVADAQHGLHSLVGRLTGNHGGYALSPWVFHWVNVVVHAVNGALIVCLVFHLTRRRALAWLAGTIFVACAVLTEAVAGVVGAADVLGGLGALLALAALRLPLWLMPFGVASATLLGLFSKESAVVCVPLVPVAALFLGPYVGRERALSGSFGARLGLRTLARCLLAGLAAGGAFVLYVQCRKMWFPTSLPSELEQPLSSSAGRVARAMRWFLVWFHQPSLPKDALNNPLVQADMPHRVAGALRVYWRGLVQLVFPRTLSGDYSFPQEPVPARLLTLETLLGGLLMAAPPFIAVGLYTRSLFLRVRARAAGAARTERAGVLLALAAFSLIWVVVCYFPHSNIPVLLPTVRAERFWYFPAMGSSVLLACYFAAFQRDTSVATRRFGAVLLALFLGFQCVKARLHAFDYADDLVFWRATKDAVPRSAKAHLNYSVMWGARGHLDTRLSESSIAVGLAPKWAMAHIYLGDTLCRLHRAEEAWPHYVEGFRLADNDPNLIALALQCLWDEDAFSAHEDELLALADAHPESWLDFLAKEVSRSGTEHGGVDPKYRPRGYNEGPKE